LIRTQTAHRALVLGVAIAVAVSGIAGSSAAFAEDHPVDTSTRLLERM